MRYFLTINASRPYIAGGSTFSFEPIQNRGGSWLGVLAVAEEAAASSLASAGLEGVEEITSERFDSLKKKLTPTPGASSASPMRRRVSTPGAVAEGVSLVGPSGRTPGVGNPLIPRPPKVEAPEPSIALQTTSQEPPREALLESPADKPLRYKSVKNPK